MRSPASALRLEELEPRILLKAPWDAPSLGPPPDPGPSVVWVNTEGGLQEAINNLQSGQTIVVQRGTYNLSQTLILGNLRAVSDVAIRGETDDYNDVVLLGAGMENADFGAVPSGFNIFNAQDVTIANLSIGEVYYHPIQLHGESGANRIHIYHTRLFNAGEQFVKSTPGPSSGVNDSTVEYSLVEYTSAPPVTDHGGGTGYTNGVDVHFGSNWIIRHNLFRNFHNPDGVDNPWSPAILVWNQSRGTLVEGNTFIDTDRAIAFGLQYQATGSDHEGGIIRNNFVYLSPGLFSPERTAGSDAPIIVWDSPDSQVHHNTILTNGNTYKSIEVRWVDGIEIRNNLADAPLGARDGSFSESGNYLQATSDMFVDPADGDLHLALTDATLAFVIGQVSRLDDVIDDWNGQIRRGGLNTDIGADEYRFADPDTSRLALLEKTPTGAANASDPVLSEQAPIHPGGGMGPQGRGWGTWFDANRVADLQRSIRALLAQLDAVHAARGQARDSFFADLQSPFLAEPLLNQVALGRPH